MTNQSDQIVVEVRGNHQKLGEALRAINQQATNVEQALKEVDRALKLDSQNPALAAQKMLELGNAVQNKNQKLTTLQNVQSQVETQFSSRNINDEQYRDFQREIATTASQLQGYSNQLQQFQAEQNALASATRDLNTFFSATRTNIDQFADVLGTRLTNAIRNGKASTDEINRALKLMGRNTLGTSANLDEMSRVLRSVENGADLDDVSGGLANISQNAEAASKAFGGFVNAQAGALKGNLTNIVEQSLDVSSLNTKIDLVFDVPEESKGAVRDAVVQMTTYIGDQDAAIEGVRRQWLLNKDQTDEANAAFVQGAGAISRAYSQIDFVDLVQEVNNMATALDITNEEALGLTDSLLNAGFPPEQLERLADYSLQMKEVGLSTTEIQAILAKGLNVENFDISHLNESIHTAQSNMKNFAQEVPKSLEGLLENTDISVKQFQSWGQAVAKGGKDGTTAMGEVSTWLKTIEDDSLRNALAMTVFGSETGHQVNDMISVFEGLADAQDQTAVSTEGVQEKVSKINADPLYKIEEAVTLIKESLRPAFELVAEFIAKIADWVGNHANVVAAITAIGVTLSILVGAFATLMPAIGGLVTAWPALAAAISAVLSPVGLVVAAIAGIGIALVAAYQNSETFRENVHNVFTQIKDTAVIVFEAIAGFISEKIALLKQFWDENGVQIMQAVENVFHTIQGVIEFVMPAIQFVIETVWAAIQNVINGALDIIMGAIQVFSGLFTGDFSAMWEGIKQLFWGAIELIIGWTTLTFFGGIRKIFMELVETGIKLLKGMWDNIATFFTTMTSNVTTTVSNFSVAIINFFKGLGQSIITTVKNIWTNSVNFFQNLSNSIKEIVSTMASSVWQFIKDLASNFLNTISGMVTNVLTKISNLSTKMLEKIKELPNKFIEIGKDIISGLIQGITNMTIEAVESITGVVDSVVSKAKSLLGIKSPSRVFAAIGSYTIQGMEIGMKGRQTQLNQVMIDLTKGLERVTLDFKENEKRITQDTNLEIEEIEKKSAAEIHQIKQLAASNNRMLTMEETNAILRIKEQGEQRINALEANAFNNREALHAKSEKARLATIKQFATEKKALNQLTLQQEADLWNQSIRLFEKGTKEHVEAQQIYQNLMQTLGPVTSDELFTQNAYGEGLLHSLYALAPSIIQKAAQIAHAIKQTLHQAFTLDVLSFSIQGVNVEINDRLVKGIQHAHLNLQGAMGTVSESLASSTDKLKSQQMAQTQIAQRGMELDMTSLVEAITLLAGRPVQTTVAMDGREVANAVSVHQYHKANLSALKKGVIL